VRIEPGSLSTAFRIAPGTAQRGAIVVQNERLTNTGSPMVLEARASALGANARIELPANVEAAIERRGGIAVFRLPPTANQVSVRFVSTSPAASPVDATAAGRVLAVETDGRQIFLQTATACVATTVAAAR